MRHGKLKLSLLPGEYAVFKLEPEHGVPEWATRNAFWSVTKTQHELSIVCLEDRIPDNIKAERGWRILRVEEPLNFSMTGVLNCLTKPLAVSKISVFALSTYLTDYLLVHSKDLKSAVKALREQGHKIDPEI